MKPMTWIFGIIAIVALVVGVMALTRAADARAEAAERDTGILDTQQELADEVGSLNETVSNLSASTVGEAATHFAVAGEMSDEELANTFFDVVRQEPYPYTWAYETGVPPGFYTSSNPAHGAVLRAYMNNISLDAVQRGADAFPTGSFIVKENHMPGDAEIPDGPLELVPGFTGNLDAITIMVKLDGYNPEAGDWFWAKYQPDGSIDAAGTPEGCIGCHQQVEDNDWVFDADLSAAN